MDCDMMFMIKVKFYINVVVSFFILVRCYEMYFLDNFSFFCMIMNSMNLIFIVMENKFMGCMLCLVG